MVSAAKIDRLTAHIIAYRFWLYNKRNYEMARLIEIAGLGDAVKGIRKEMASIRTIAGEINTDAPKLRAELTDIRDQIREHRADIAAEAGSMGNGGEPLDEQSGKASQRPPETQQTAIQPSQQPGS